MKIISCENFALQSSTLTGATDTIYKCLNSGRRYYWTGSAFKEYFEVAQGGNITITPLAQNLPKASVSGRNVIDTPYATEIIDNVNRITGQIVMPSANNTFARSFIAPHTGNYMSAAVMITNVAGGTIYLGIYDRLGNLIVKTSGVADSSRSNGMVNSSFWYDSAGVLKSTAGAYLTGGETYFIGISCTSVTTGFAGFSGLPNYSVPAAIANPTQSYATGNVPVLLTLNGSNQTVFPYVKLEIRA